MKADPSGLRIGIVSHSNGAGGAAIAAARLHASLLQIGADSRMFVRHVAAKTANTEVLGAGWPAIVGRLRSPLVSRALRLGRFSGRSGLNESLNVVPSRVAAGLNASALDIVNLHWIHREAMGLADISRITKPVVITLHDMWWLLGSEHYRDDFGNPAPPWSAAAAGSGSPNWGRLDDWMLARKRRLLPQRLAVLAPSNWLAEQARRSEVFAGVPVQAIANPLPLDIFKPFDAESRRQLRRGFGLPTDKRVLSFGAFHVDSDLRKGARELIAALAEVARQGAAEQYALAIFGGQAPRELRELPFAITEVGEIRSPTRMAELLNSVDAAVVPSRLENLPQTATEAIACGCPVLGFDISGMRDAVVHGVTGLLAPVYSAAGLAAHILRVGESDLLAAFRAAGPRFANENWESRRVATQTLRFFEAFAHSHGRGATRSWSA
jgi:glycosyltransferase involved in cell wall biosynthesis